MNPWERTLGKWGAEKEGARNSQFNKEGMVNFLEDGFFILNMLFLLQADDIWDVHDLQGIVSSAWSLLHQVHSAKCSSAWGRQWSQSSLPWIRKSIHIWGMDTMLTWGLKAGHRRRNLLEHFGLYGYVFTHNCQSSGQGMAPSVKGLPWKRDDLSSNLGIHVRRGGGQFKLTQQLLCDLHKDAIACNHTYM